MNPVTGKAGLFRLAAWLVLLGISGCSTDPTSTVSYRTVAAAFAPARAEVPDAEQLVRFPYAAAFVQIGDNPKGMMVLAEAEETRLKWASAEPVILVTDQGRITRLANWPQELVGFRSSEQDPLPRMVDTPRAEFRYEIDLMPGYRSNLEMVAVLEQHGLQTIRVGHWNRSLLHVVENLAAPSVGFSAENHYWLDPQTGSVWRSLQTPAPGWPQISIEVVKPYGG